MKNLFILLLLPFCVNANELILGEPTGNSNAGYGGRYSFNVNSSGQPSIALLAGEDQTNGVFKVEGQFSRCLATADTVCKASAGFVHSVYCYGVDAAATAGRVRLVDDATVTGTAANEVWGAEFAAALQPPVGNIIDQVMTRGIEFDFTTTADVTCVVSYR